MINSTQQRTIVLIPGLWMTALSWEHWIERYVARGHRVIAKSWPGMDGDIDELRRDPSGTAQLGVTEIVEHYEVIIRELSEPPIVIGHSFGGAITQIILDHGLGAAGVAIDSAPLKGIFRLPWASLKSAFPVLKNPANSHRSVPLTPEEFQYAFTNTLSKEESLAAYQRYAVPGPGRVLFQGALANMNPHAVTRVDFHNDRRAPLLLIAGELDHVAPPSVTRANAKLQQQSQAITAYKEFPGRTHFILGQPGWETVADFALNWALHPIDLPIGAPLIEATDPMSSALRA
jgi:pimeloyl-ACP methyl ester carboxylesterase